MGALLAMQGQTVAMPLLSRKTVQAQGWPQPGPSPWPGHLNSPDDTQHTSRDLGARVSQLHHAVGTQGTNDILEFAVLTAHTKVRRPAHSFAERQSAPHMGEVGRARARYVVSSHSVQLLAHCTEVLDFHTTPEAKLPPTSKGRGLTLEVIMCLQGASPESNLRRVSTDPVQSSSSPLTP